MGGGGETSRDVERPSLATSTPAVVASPVAAEGKSTGGSGYTRPKANDVRVLFVEDNVMNRRLGHRILSRAGFSVTVAEDGVDAVEAVTSRAPSFFDVVFMDVHMPRMDGLEASRVLSRLPFRVPIVALTANATAQDRSLCFAAGCVAFCTKPITPENLTRMVWSLVELNANTAAAVGAAGGGGDTSVEGTRTSSPKAEEGGGGGGVVE